MRVRRLTFRSTMPGYTVVELLIVVLIISILMAILIPIVADMLGTSRKAATRTTIKKIAELLRKRQNAFTRKFPDYYRATYGQEFEQRRANPTAVMRRKEKYREMFLITPMRGALGTLPGTNLPQPIRTAADSSEVLYFLLTKAETFGTIAADRDEFTASEVADTDGDGRMEFVDAWGKPIRYYPFPTRLFKPGGHTLQGANNGVDTASYPAYRIMFRAALSPGELNIDPDDRLLVLTSTAYREAPATGIEPIDYTAFYHTFQTFHTPLVVSAGGDGVLGLYEPGDFANFGHLARPIPAQYDNLHDNISNHNLTAGGQ